MPVLRAGTSRRRTGPARRRVALVSEELARRAWPGRSPLGGRAKVLGSPDVPRHGRGVVGNIRQITLTEPPTPQLYLAKAKNPHFSSVAARTDGDPETRWPTAPRAICRWTPTNRWGRSARWSRSVARDLAPQRFTRGALRLVRGAGRLCLAVSACTA